MDVPGGLTISDPARDRDGQVPVVTARPNTRVSCPWVSPAAAGSVADGHSRSLDVRADEQVS